MQGAALPFLGGISGFANSDYNIVPGSYNYIYLGATAQTAPGAAPAVSPNTFTIATDVPEAIESAIWSIDLSSSVLSLQ